MAIDAVGVPQLERLVSPFPPGSAVLFLNDPGVDAEPFLHHAAHAHLSQGGEVVYVVTDRPPRSVLAAMASYGLDPTPHRARLRFLDAYSPALGVEEPGARPVANDPAALAEALEEIARDAPGGWLLVDSLSGLLDVAGEERFLAAFPRLHAAMKSFALSEATFTRWPYSPAVDALLQRFDAVVGVRGVEDRVTTGTYFVVERARWKPSLPAAPRLFKAMKPGGVHVYVPKVLVTGPHDAGKTTFVHAVSDTAVSAEHQGTTVALDHGRVTMDGLTADVFGTPGQERFDPMLGLLAGQAVGVIVVVDSTKPDSFPRAREMLLKTWRHGLPGLIAANKQDEPGAVPPDEVARLLDPPPRVRVVGCRARDRDSARRVLHALLDRILFPEEEAPA